MAGPTANGRTDGNYIIINQEVFWSLVTKVSTETAMPTEILVPTDGSDRAETIIRRAIERVEIDEGTIHLLYVVDTRRYGEPALSSTAVLIDCFEDEGRDHLRSLVEAGRNQDVETEAYCRRGNPADVAARMARDVGIDIVIPCLEGVTPRTLERYGIDRDRIVDTKAAMTA